MEKKKILDIVLSIIYLSVTLSIGYMYLKGLEYSKFHVGILFLIQVLTFMGIIYISHEKTTKEKVITILPSLVAFIVVLVLFFIK